ncbi:PHD finger protein 7-like isoform X2 [Gallus gallus]|uniref:PHD finger protein 7-like isoform X2 n=1 Tax=Gallus gallus TaxID=9031 RepID=UPI001AE8DF28|nr:PHD finger protein 7-like isoform X2 [Gallus gallus]
MHTMSEGTQEAAGSREPACVLCGRVDEDSIIHGHKHEDNGFYFHTFCVIFANGLCQPGKDNRNASFYAEDMIRTVRQAEQTLCFVCGNSGATITCAESGCHRSFHLPCALEGQCVTQYIGEFRSFCWEHRPQQAVEAAPAQDTTCIICMEPVGDSRSYSTMVCPSCQHSWFHRACIQEQAMRAGIYCFQCPLCRDRDWFIPDMLTMGIRIPFRRPTWEDNNAYAALGVRHQRCDASNCLYPHGREQAEREGPWQLLLCSSCAAQGTHRCCSNLSQSTTSWECNACAGEGTGKRQTATCCWAGPGEALLQSLWPRRDGSLSHPGAGDLSCSPFCLPLQPPAPIWTALAPTLPASRDWSQPESLRDRRAAAPAPPARHHRGQIADPGCLRAACPGSQGGPRLEAARLSNVRLQRPAASPEDAAGAGPGGEGQPRGEAAPGYHDGPGTSTAGPSDATGAAMYQRLALSEVIRVHHNKTESSFKCVSLNSCMQKKGAY